MCATLIGRGECYYVICDLCVLPRATLPTYLPVIT